MADARLTSRFDNLVKVVNQSCTQLSSSSTTAQIVYGSTVTLEAGEVQAGMTFRWKCSGTKTGTNAAHTVALWASNASSALLTLTVDDATAVDWAAEINLVFYGGSQQKCWGYILNDTADAEVNYAAATNSCKEGVTFTLKMASGHASDTVTVEVCTVESWIAPLSTS
jgi:hypothetical protein